MRSSVPPAHRPRRSAPVPRRAPGRPVEKRWIIARLPISCQKCLQKQQSTRPRRRRTQRRRRLVLASTSRYRRMLLERFGIPFVAVAPRRRRDAARRRSCRRRRRSGLRRPRHAASRPRIRMRSSSARTRSPTATGVRSASPERTSGRVAQLAELSGKTVVFHTGARAARRRDRANARPRSSTCAAPTAFLPRPRSRRTCAANEPYDCAAAFAPRRSASRCSSASRATIPPR